MNNKIFNIDDHTEYKVIKVTSHIDNSGRERFTVELRNNENFTYDSLKESQVNYFKRLKR